MNLIYLSYHVTLVEGIVVLGVYQQYNLVESYLQDVMITRNTQYRIKVWIESYTQVLQETFTNRCFE